MQIRAFTVLFILFSFLSFGAAKKKSTVAGSITVKELSEKEIIAFSKSAASAKIKSRLPQIDILNAILQEYRDDADLLSGRKELLISGKTFAKAFFRVEKLFIVEIKDNDPMLTSTMEAPEIIYSNFKAITLFGKGGQLRIKVELVEAYEQELPYTFGAKIKMQSSFQGTVKTVANGNLTDIVFDDPEDVFFKAPGIAFFIPDVFTKVARIKVEEGCIIGYVIGNPKSAKNRFVAVSYNITTCAKKSIKSKELSPDSYKEIASLRR
jgi:hypothetical protein